MAAERITSLPPWRNRGDNETNRSPSGSGASFNWSESTRVTVLEVGGWGTRRGCCPAAPRGLNVAPSLPPYSLLCHPTTPNTEVCVDGESNTHNDCQHSLPRDLFDLMHFQTLSCIAVCIYIYVKHLFVCGLWTTDHVRGKMERVEFIYEDLILAYSYGEIVHSLL